MQSQIRHFETPKRFKGRTGLQIFVDRFYREGEPPKPMEGRILKEWNDSVPNWQPDENGVYQNDYFYGGNLKGITSKLDYIRKNNFNLIYLSPLGLSETSHHYEPTDQLQIDPWIGTWKDFCELCEEAHKRDILIVVDLVFNHMGTKSSIFQEALKKQDSQYHDWFEWDKNGNPIFWSGFDNMPQCNKLNPDYQEYACQVSSHYIKMGADGIRLDLGENFPREFLTKLRNEVKRLNPEALIVSEMWKLDTERLDTQLDGTQVDSVMNYPMADAILRWVRYGNVSHFNYMFDQIKKYHKQVQEVLWNFLDSHDTPRAINLLVGDGITEDPYKGDSWDIESPWRHEGFFDTYGFRKWEFEHENIDITIAKQSIMAASAIQYFIMGNPIVFAGTEIGTTGYKDPFNRKPYNWDNPNQEILEHYRKLGELRNKHREFFSEVGEIETEVFGKYMKLIRKNSCGEMHLEIVRNPADKKQGWSVKIFLREY